jgi:hypothetical protein
MTVSFPTRLELRVPYTQQFTPKQTPLRDLMAVVARHAGDRAKLSSAIAKAFFKTTATPVKVAGNTLVALKYFGIIDDHDRLTDFGNSLNRARTDAEAHRQLAQRLLLHLDGIPLVETLRELQQAGQKIALGSLPDELKRRGFKTTANSSDLSGVFNWLRVAGVLRKDYEINEDVYGTVVGTDVREIAALKDLNEQQLYFLRALIAIGVEDFTPYNTVARHAEGLYPGLVRYNWKEIDRVVLRPLAERGLVEIRRVSKSTPGARGGKAASVKPTLRLKTDVADLILATLGKAAGFADYREIARKSWPEILQMVEAKNPAVRGRGLELLTIKIAFTLDLEFMGWRTTDEALAAGGEVDAMLQSNRLIYSRWQIQCKASPRISLEAVAKEVGLADVTLATVILLASTGIATRSARTYRDQIIRSRNLNIIFLEGQHLRRIVAQPSAIVSILNDQARDAFRVKGKPTDLETAPPTNAKAEAK